VKVLVVNAGSSSVKFTLFAMDKQEQVIAKGLVERIGQQQPNLKYERYDGVSLEETAAIGNHLEALQLITRKLTDAEVGVLRDLSEVNAIGHRVVHGGEAETDSALITDKVMQVIRDCASLAPLHNPPNLDGITACQQAFPGTPNVAVFDTAFHQSMPPASYLYAIPYEYYQQYGLRKYGFHGTSHKYVCQATAEYLQRPLAELKLITCHLGNGCSIAAVDGGKVIDTSMGLTPLAGLIMGTRCGDIDPGCVLHLAKQGMTIDEIDKTLNKNSGLLGVAGIGSSDMRDILAAVGKGNERAQRAFDMFVHRMVSYIGSYFTLLGGADAVVFTGGIGENSIPARTATIRRLAALGCCLDESIVQVMGAKATLSTAESTLKAVIMPTNEELMISRETVRVLA